MGTTEKPLPVTLICGMIAADEALFAAAEGALEQRFGPPDLRSETWPFDLTDYYASELGPGLKRRFVSFAAPIDPGRLAAIKAETNGLEQAMVVGGRRRINLDPGYVTAAKLVLATTKDFSHRIYLGDGIYAEVTLNFAKHGCRPFAWTYPDFRAERYWGFFQEVRRRHIARGG